VRNDEDGRIEDYCWKRIGVWGSETQRCAKLAEVIHCRNCAFFTQAGRSLLERDLPEEYARERAEVMAIEKEEDLPGATTVVIFQIGEESLGLPAHIFAEITGPEKPHSVPGRKNPVLLGLVNIHGELHLCVSLGKLLGLEQKTASRAERSTRGHMIVLDREGERWVFPVDKIHGVHRIGLEAFQNIPVTLSRGESTYTRGIFAWQGRSVAFLDEDLLLKGLARSVQ